MNRFLMTEEEIKIIAALSGVKRVMIFFYPNKASVNLEVVAINRLLNEGILIRKERQIGPSDEILPIVNIFQRASQVILIRDPKKRRLPFCVYLDDGQPTVLCITPHENKCGLFRIFLSDSDALLEELENSRMIPTTLGDDYEGLNIASEGRNRLEEDCSNYEEDIEKIKPDETISTFEKLNISSGEVVGKLVIFRTPLSWGLYCPGERVTYFSRNLLLKWIRG